MTLAQGLTAIIVFWAVIGGLGASLLLPAMQSLIHGNFSGPAQKKAYALVGASAAIAAAFGPLLGGFVTTYLSWRVGFALEVVIILLVLSQIRLVRDVAYTGPRKIDVVGALLSVVGMGGVVLGILVWQEGGEFVGLLMAVGAVALAVLARWLIRRKRAQQVTLLDPDLFRHANFTAGISGQLLQQVALGGAMIALPLFFQMTLEYSAMLAGLSLAPLSLTMFAAALVAGRKAGDRRPAAVIRAGFLLVSVGVLLIIPLVPRVDSGWWLVVPLMVAGCGLGLLVSQLNNYTLAPVAEERVSEAAGVNSAAGSFGLSFGLAMAGGLMLAALSLSFTAMTESSSVIPPTQQAQIATALDENAQVMSNTALDQRITGQPPAVEEEVLAINDDARNLSLQVALAVPLLAGLLGLANSFRMMRLPDLLPAAPVEGMDLG
jgi:MFS family permease